LLNRLSNFSSKAFRSCVLILMVGVFLLPSLSHTIGNDGADGKFERRDSFHFVLFQDVDLDESSGIRGSRHFEQRLLATLEGAFDLLDSLLGIRPSRKIEVFVWDAQIFDERFSGLFRFPAAGFYGGAIHIRGDVRLTGRLVRVLHHELVHAAFDAAAPRLVLPAWMNEGIAEWFEARAMGRHHLSEGERETLMRAVRGGALFPLADLSSPSFGRLSPASAQLAYLESHAFIDYLVQTHGERDLVRFSRDVIRKGNLDRAARRAYRMDLKALEAGFRRSLGLH
jgi:hypothetical protein